MHFLISTAISLALISHLASAASCSSFTPSREPYTQPASKTQIISKGITCDSSSADCRIEIGGYVTDTRSLNITIDNPDPIYQLISSTVDFPFNTTVTTFVGGSPNPNTPQIWPIRNGTSGYVGFTANHRCTAGKLSSCDTATLEDVYVEACTPYSRSEQLSGTVATITTDRDSAMALTCNPANTTAAKNGNNRIVAKVRRRQETRLDWAVFPWHCLWYLWLLLSLALSVCDQNVWS